jgi:hypothetical protein
MEKALLSKRAFTCHIFIEDEIRVELNESDEERAK